MTSYTVQCGYAGYYAQTVTVEAETPEAACEAAILRANDRDSWKNLDHCGDTFVDALTEGENTDPWGPESLPVPFAFTEDGPGVRVVIRIEGGTVQAVETAGGRVTVVIDDRDDGQTHEPAFPDGGAS